MSGGAEAGRGWSYTYRPSLLGAGWQFRLTDDGIAWDVGRKAGHIAYRDVRRVRMSYRPMTMQSHRFITEISAVNGPRLDIASTSWKSLVEQERLDQAYTDFIAETHRRIAASGAPVLFAAGGNAVRYWVGVVLFAGVAIGLAALAVRAVQVAAWGAAGIIAVFLMLFLWQAGGYFRRNKPGRYDPAALPAELLP